MPKISIDLTGRGGLAPNFAGDLNDTSPAPNLRYLGGESQVADGVYDPLRVLGYMAPANNKFAALTGTINTPYVTRAYDSRTDKLFLAGSSQYIDYVSGLAGTSVTNYFNSASNTANHDMELYEINGFPAVIYSYTYDTTGSDASDHLGFFSTDTSKGIFTLAARVFETGVSDDDEAISSIDHQALAQRFSTSDAERTEVSGIRLRLKQHTAVTQTWTLQVSIQTDNAGAPSGTDVSGTVVTMNPASLPEDWDFVYFTFPAIVALSAATTYHIVVKPTVFGDLSGGEGVDWFRSNGDNSLYANGQALQYNGSAWSDADTTDESYDFALVLNRLGFVVTRDGISGLHEYTQSPTGYEFLQKADNGFLYWFTGSHVHKFDGGTTGGNLGAFTQDVLVFPEFLRCVDAVDTNSLMYIAIQSSEKSDGADYRTFGADTMGVYQWDRLSTVLNTRNFIPIYGAREIKRIWINADGDLRVITIGEDRRTEIRGIVNGRLVVLHSLGISSYPRLRDSVDFLNNMLTWIAADNYVYACGKLPGSDSEQVYKIGHLSNGFTGSATPGILQTGNSESSLARQGVFISYAATSPTNALVKWYPHGIGTINTVAQLGHQGDVYSIQTHLPYLSDVANIMITCAPNGQSGGSTVAATIKFYKNMETTPFMTKSVTYDQMKRGYLSYEINKQWVNAIQLEIEWSTSVTLGANDFLPAFAVLDYKASPTIPK